jgi:hypothetical protein
MVSIAAEGLGAEGCSHITMKKDDDSGHIPPHTRDASPNQTRMPVR